MTTAFRVSSQLVSHNRLARLAGDCRNRHGGRSRNDPAAVMVMHVGTHGAGGSSARYRSCAGCSLSRSSGKLEPQARLPTMPFLLKAIPSASTPVKQVSFLEREFCLMDLQIIKPGCQALHYFFIISLGMAAFDENVLSGVLLYE